MSSPLSAEVNNFNWLLQRFATQTTGVTDAIAVSSDGLLIATSHSGDRASSDRLAAIVSGITSLAGGVSSGRALGRMNKVIIDMEEGYLLVSAIGAGCVLGTVTDKSTNLGTIAYEMTLFANRAGATLNPHLINELKNSAQV
ncbi:roadblock/LC7 domain-containing protein [Streptacidiphilus sp. ASG 303]|uniref:roadblock/LC7 domain-containing protein n=1 Tax=Streptacidiphilus sp. ASG 303 TaxID=2896847 RepID=UPI001E3A2C4A|nr:roadblock/LC7 domain-containing protein [Streptacidiphilus sp. ASG 303]MCD0484114.1 roadblock/LC7 domain-containing protein [Streptacidiphilus sp. ASG 303]